MAIQIKSTRNFDLKDIKKKLGKRLPKMINLAAQIAKDEINIGIKTSKDIDGRPFVPLLPATIKAKRRRKLQHPSRPLWATGIMKNVYFVKRATISDPKATIRVPIARSDDVAIGKFHHMGDDPQPERKWFGLTVNAEKRIRKMYIYETLKALRGFKHGGL